MVRPFGGQTRLYDFFVQTPLGKTARPEFFEKHADFGETTQAFHIGNGASATPGMVPGLFRLHTELATLKMAELLAPAVQAARAGIVVTAYQHLLSTVVAPILLASKDTANLFAPGGVMVAAGDVLKNPGLADLFDLLASHDLASYDGEVRTAMLASQEDGGHLTNGDFIAYQTVERQPLNCKLGGLDISLNPVPSAGGVLIAHTLFAMPQITPLDLAHALDETDRQRRSSGGDLAKLTASIGPPSYRGTTHISVIDAAGDACAMTLSNGEGNGRLVPGFGFMLNNMLGESDVNPDGAIGWAVNRRLSSIMCPSIVHADDGTLIALGSGGSNRIRSAIATVLCALSHDRHDIEASTRAPRMHIEAGHLDVEGHFAPGVITALKAAFNDHRIWPKPSMFFGGCHIAARLANGHLTGAGDARRAGHCVTV